MLLEAFVRDTRPLSRFEIVAARVGLCSYSIYLFHNAAFLLLPWIHGHIYPARPYLDLSVTLAILFVLVLIPCWWSYRYIELGSVNLGNYFWRMRGAWWPGRASAGPVYLPTRESTGES
jgi:peptidoglycan/LPS O-acetylase OafA/YrhL